MFEDFEAGEVTVEETTIFVRRAGDGPPLLLLHGFPQTHVMWHAVAPLLAQRFTTVCADLRGYGRSGCPASQADHAPYSKRAMGRDMVALMHRLGFDRFALVGHDRGGRVAYRTALDHPARISALAVLDIVPTEEVWSRADARLALGFWPWSLLAQPKPLPERLLQATPEAVVDDALSGWGSPAAAFPADARAAYVDALRDPAHAHAICEEYRAAAAIDREHDRFDLENDRQIACPTLVLWSRRGALDLWYAGEGGPLSLWRKWCLDVTGRPLNAGHFFPEELPQETASLLTDFFESGARVTLS
jgi:haloacetate dehalogenase